MVQKGKSYDYFKDVVHSYPNYYYYMKCDTDSYINFAHLAIALYHQPRNMATFGLLVTWDNPRIPFYCLGMGYIMTHDLVRGGSSSSSSRSSCFERKGGLVGITAVVVAVVAVAIAARDWP